jgi:hypothetical protein
MSHFDGLKYVNTRVIFDLTLELLNLSKITESMANIWRYMACSLHYIPKPKVIVIGQSSYDPDIIPTLGSAFSQSVSSKDNPTTHIFSRHFANQELARDFIRSTWKLLPLGCIRLRRLLTLIYGWWEFQHRF